MTATVEKTDKLTETERTRLGQCEATIRRHFETFREAGEALAEIRDTRLYREAYSTFESYCRARWEMSKTQANRLIAASSAVKELEKAEPKIAEAAAHLTESAARPLTQLKPAEQKKAMAKAIKATGGTLTAKAITAAAKEVAPKAFARAALPKTTDGRGDFIRRSEVLDEFDAWRKTAKKYDKATFNALREIVVGL